MGNGLLESAKENLGFLGVCLVAVVGLVLVAYLLERAARAKNGGTERILATRKIVMIGMFSALSGILYCFDFSIPVIAPEFYKLDFSELPAMIAGFAFGPVAGVLVEFIKDQVGRHLGEPPLSSICSINRERVRSWAASSGPWS